MNVALRKKIRALMSANRINEYTALRYAERLEGASETDAAGKAIVRDELGRELARINVPQVTGMDLEDTLEDTRREQSRRAIPDAEIVVRDGRHFPIFTHAGRIFAIETKPSLLDLGIAAMQPLQPDLTEDYGAPVERLACLPADPENGRPEDRTLNHFTTHPIAVALARRFYVLCVLGEAEEGPITITTSDIES